MQTCVVHLIRYSLAHASWKERKELAGALRPIYQADTLEEAEEALDGFEVGSLGRKFPAIVRSWRRNWTQVIPFFAFSKPIRRVIYTTNAIESLNSTVWRAVRTRGHFPNDRAAAKLIYLTLRKVERKWQRPQAFWSQARGRVRHSVWGPIPGGGCVNPLRAVPRTPGRLRLVSLRAASSPWKAPSRGNRSARGGRITGARSGRSDSPRTWKTLARFPLFPPANLEPGQPIPGSQNQRSFQSLRPTHGIPDSPELHAGAGQLHAVAGSAGVSSTLKAPSSTL